MGTDRGTARAAAYDRAQRLRARARRLSEGVFDGVWLGLLDAEDLRAVDRAFYAGATESVDGQERAYGDVEHVRQGLSDWERRAVAGLPTGARVVVTSAGAGREVHGLLDLGLDAIGFEPNEHLVGAGRAVLDEQWRLRGCDYDTFPADAGRADAVVVGWGSYMLVRGRGARVRLLQGAFDVLEPGGLLVVSYFDRPPTRYFTVAAGVGGAVRRLRRRGPVELGDALSPNFVHYFTPAEVRAELDAAGFDVERVVRVPYGHAVARRR